MRQGLRSPKQDGAQHGPADPLGPSTEQTERQTNGQTATDNCVAPNTRDTNAGQLGFRHFEDDAALAEGIL
eukprot:8808455-Lingulodinium_polyedra.AAC.1